MTTVPNGKRIVRAFGPGILAALLVSASGLWLESQLRAQTKTACDIIPLDDISAAFGREMFLRPTRPQLATNCTFSSVGPFDRPTGPVVNLIITLLHAPAPDRDAMVDQARQLLQQRQVQTTNVANVGDAAFWFGNEQTGELHVFRSGVDALVLAGQLPLEKMKTLAAKALGGPTGFAYNGTDTLNKPGPTAIAAAQPPLVGGASFSQAVYITQAEFLNQVKEVSLALNASPQLTKYMPVSEQRSYVTKALANRGITVRAGAPVVLLAAFDELDAEGTTTKTYSDGRVETEKFPIHDVFVTLDFYVRAVVMRNGQAHLVTVAPAHSSQGEQYVEDSDLRKLLFGNPTVRDVKDLVAWLLDDSLDRLSTNYAIDPTPWYANGWTAAQKNAADAEFLRLMNSGASDRIPTTGIDTMPKLELFQPATDDPEEACPSPNAWQAEWTAALQRTGWTKPSAQPTLALRHSFICRHMPVFRFPLGYFRLTDELSLRESNAVFVLNGRVFRKPATLVSTHHEKTDKGDDMPATVQAFIQPIIDNFPTLPRRMDLYSPEITATPIRIAPGTASADNPAARAAVFHPDAWERKWDVPFYPVSQYTPALARKGRLILKGTVARLGMDGSFPQWLRIYFKEAPDNAVTLCTPSADIFDQFGGGYQGLVGRQVEAAGDIDGLCTPKGGIRILESDQFRAYTTEPNVP